MTKKLDWIQLAGMLLLGMLLLCVPGDGQPAPVLSLGEALYARGYRVSAWYRQPDGALVTGRFDPAAVDFEARYGAGSSTRKGSIQGENLCPDFIFPELAVDLGLPGTYAISRVDLQDLRMVRDAYKGLQAMYRRKTGLEPCGAPVEVPTPTACPAGASCRPEPSPCPPAKVCPDCLAPATLAPVPLRIRETANILDGWPAGRAFGLAMQARADELAKWLRGVVAYQPSLLSTGRAETGLVPR